MDEDTSGMKYIRMRLTDKKSPKDGRRFRNILANSGEVMESGEVRDLEHLYVMSRDGELIQISKLNSDPDKQTEDYTVQAQADHGEYINGELIPSMEKQFGSCKVWLEDDGLHARMYFADDDELADHAWAISEDASYSIGADWFPDGYYGTGYEIEEPIGILREISMVLTGNDPRAKTIDHLDSEDKAQRGVEEDDGKTISTNKENTMNPENKKDVLTADEAADLKATMNDAIDALTTEEEATEAKEDSKDSETTEAPAEETKEEATKDTVHMPMVIIRDRAAKQETAKTTDWLTSKAGKAAFANTLKQVGHFGGTFDAAWRAEVAKHQSLDGISGLPVPVAAEQIFIDALEKADGIISHFANIDTKSFRIHAMTPDNDEAGRAKGHKKGDTKAFQALTDAYRDVLVKMIYKKLDLDATELYENPELIDFRARELAEALVLEIERAAIIGDGREAPEGTAADYRVFDGTRGLYSIAADAAAGSGIGTLLAGSVNAGDNLYDSVVAAKGAYRGSGRPFLVAKSSAITALLQAKLNNAYIVQPGAQIEDILGVSRVYTPGWMDNDTVNDAYLIGEGAYKLIGQTTPTQRSEFDTTNNTDVLLMEIPRGGSLGEYKGAIAIKKAGTKS